MHCSHEWMVGPLAIGVWTLRTKSESETSSKWSLCITCQLATIGYTMWVLHLEIEVTLYISSKASSAQGKPLKSGHYIVLEGVPTHKGQSRALCCDAPIQCELLGKVGICKGDSAPVVDMLALLSRVGGGRIHSRVTQKDNPTWPYHYSGWEGQRISWDIKMPTTSAAG